jgi:cation diffusion facilitator family transporter
MDVRRRKTIAALLSVLSNTALVALKVAVGFLTGSVSVMSEAIHSGMDLVASFIALFTVRASGLPADENHPYGHNKLENLAGLAEALLIFVAAIWIIYEAVYKLFNPIQLDEPVLGVAVMALSAAANIAVSWYLFRVGKATDSLALTADAWHLRTDVWTSAGVMAGLFSIWLGGYIFPDVDLSWLDPAAALAVALLIMHAAWRLTMQSIRDLIDESMPANERRWIVEHLKGMQPVVKGFHGLRTRKAGGVRFVEFHMQVAADMHVDESHRVTDQLTGAIQEHFSGSHVLVHIEPCDGICKPTCAEGCLLDDEERRKISGAGP